jgi:hypothetical protein
MLATGLPQAWLASLSMTASRFHLSGFPRAIGLAVLQNLVAVLWLAASPALHAAADKDASEPEHACAVTLFEARNFHAPTTHANSRAQTGCACARGTFFFTRSSDSW